MRIHLILALVVFAGGWGQAQVPSMFNAQVERPGTVYAMAWQANGQVIVGGSFERVNGVPRNNLARLNADGSLDDAWNPDANATVKAIAVSGTNIIVGGLFTNVGGQVRYRVASLNYQNGQALPSTWAQGANGEVRSLAIYGSAVYAGGVFTQIAGVGRARLARLDLGGVAHAAFTNGANDAVNALVMLTSNLLVGGDFSQIGGQARSYLHKVSGWSGSAMSWNGRPDLPVSALAFSGSYLFAGGGFLSISSTNRPLVARLDDTTGHLLTSWNAGMTFPGLVSALAISGDSLLLAGSFTNVGAAARQGFAKVSLVSGAESTSWSNGPDDDIKAMVVSGTNVLIGGSFSTFGPAWASGITRLLTNGTRDVTFTARVCDPGIVYCINTQFDGRILIGGTFASVDGVERPGSARFFTDGSLDASWLSRADGSVKMILPYGTNIYLAGTFSSLDGRDCYGVGKVSGQDGLLLAGWTNRIKGLVSGIAADGTHLYAGGQITNINGQTFRYLARFLHAGHRVDTSWAPVCSNSIFALAADGTHLYVGGAMRYLNGGVTNLARITLATGVADLTWRPAPNDWVQILACDVSNVYAAGYFNQIGGLSMDRLARVRKVGAGVVDAAWDPSPQGGSLYALHLDGEWVYAGGSFTSIGGESFPYLGRVAVQSGDADSSWMPAPDASVYAVHASGVNVLAGGMFNNIGGMRRLALAHLEPFAVLGLSVSNRIPVLTWRGGSNRTFAVDFIGDATYPYVQVTNGLSGDGEIQRLVDAGRFNYPRLFYRVWME